MPQRIPFFGLDKIKIMKKLLLSALLAVSGIVSAQTVVIGPSQDNSIYSENSNSSGAGQLYSGNTCSGDQRRTLIQFDIAGNIPAGATITSVQLDLNCNNVSPSAGNDNYTLHLINTAWGEGTSAGGGTGSPAIAPDATWTDAMFGTSTWTSAGGDFSAASASTTLPNVTGTYSWNSAGMVADVQSWLDTPGSNFGWALIGNESTTCTARRFGSQEQGTAPVLTINYTCSTPPNAVCQNITSYLDAAGNATILASDIDGGSSLVCGTSLSFGASQTAFNCSDIVIGPTPTSLVISAVYDGPLAGGVPKGVELYVINDIPDLSIYGLGSANNGGGTDGVEFLFPGGSATAGDYIYVSSEGPGFTAFFGFPPNFTGGALNINGDDAIELFENSVVIDVFGDINVLGTGQPWEYLDSWAYRVSSTGPDGSFFTLGNWTFGGPNVLDGEADNATAASPVPIGTFTTPSNVPGTSVTLTVTDDLTNSSTCNAIVTVLDTLPPTMDCVAPFTLMLDGAGNGTLNPGDLDNGTVDACGIMSLSLSKTTFTCADVGLQQVTLYATDIYGNIDSCTTDVTVDGSAAMTITSVTIVEPTCNGDCDGSVTISATGAVNYSIDGGATSQASNVFNSLCALSDVLVLDNGAGCIISQPLIVTEPSAVVLTSVNDTVCPGAMDGVLVLTATGGVAPYTITLDGNSGPFTGLGAGTYSGNAVDANGCAAGISVSVVDAPAIDITVALVGSVYTANQSGATYQWIDCADLSAISGENTASYDMTVNPAPPANVAVVITDAFGCSDTSVCLAVGTDGMTTLDNLTISLHPNPSKDVLNVFVAGYNENLMFSIKDVNGRLVAQDAIFTHKAVIDVSAFENGVYFMTFTSNEGSLTKRIIVQH